jgi:hypothetical protein
LEQAAASAKRRRQIAIWDRGARAWAIALHDASTNQLLPLSDEEAALVLNRDRLVRRQWCKWNAAAGNLGSLIIIEGERVKAILEAARDERKDDDDVKGLA